MHLLSAQSASPYEYIQQHAGRRERGEERKKKKKRNEADLFYVVSTGRILV